MHGATDAVERLQSILDRPLRTYTAFVREVAPAAQAKATQEAFTRGQVPRQTSSEKPLVRCYARDA
jgi:hypothetical protein